VVTAKVSVAQAIQESVGEAPLCWGIGQSVESRFSQSGRPNAFAELILRQQATRLARPHAVRLPRLFVIALTPTTVYLFDPPMREPRQPFASASRANLRVEAKRGLFWTRLTLEDVTDGRTMTMFFSRLAKGRKQILSSLPPATA
jgi:hypothetical protein